MKDGTQFNFAWPINGKVIGHGPGWEVIPNVVEGTGRLPGRENYSGPRIGSVTITTNLKTERSLLRTWRERFPTRPNCLGNQKVHTLVHASGSGHALPQAKRK